MPDYGEPEQITIRIVANGRVWEYSEHRGLELTTVAPGGDEWCRFEVDAFPPYDLPPGFAHVEVADALGVFWIGRLVQPDLNAVNEQGALTLLALGYSNAATDQKFLTDQEYTAGTTVEQAMQHARDTLCPELDQSNALMIATGRTLDGPSPNFRFAYAQAVWNSLIEFGTDPGQNPLVWLVWNGGAGSVPYLQLKPRPTAAEWTLTLSGGTQGVKDAIDYRAVETRVSIVWTDDQGDEQVTTIAGSSPLRGGRTGNVITRDKVENVGSAITTSAGATAYANALLNKYGSVRYTGGSISLIHNQADILDTALDAVPIWRLRAGYQVEVTDHGVAEGMPADLRYVVHTHWSRDAGTQELSIGELHGQIRSFRQALAEENLLADDGPGSTPVPPTISPGGGGGFSLDRIDDGDGLVTKVSYLNQATTGTKQVPAPIDHEHPGRTGWPFNFGGAGTVIAPSLKATVVAPYPAIATGYTLRIDGGAGVEIAVTKNGAPWFIAAGLNGAIVTLGDLPVNQLAADDVVVATFATVLSGSPTHILFQLFVGRGV